MTEEETKYCSICNKQVEKYGRRKEDFRKPGWVFCPRHGWIQENVHDVEIDLKSSISSTEEVPEKYVEEEKHEVNEAEILPEAAKPETLLVKKPQEKADSLDETKLKIANLVTKKERFFVGLTISAIFVTILLFSILNYFVLKNPIYENSKIKSLKAPVQREVVAKQVQSQSSSLSEDPVLIEKSSEHVKSLTSSTNRETISESAKTKPKEKTNEKLSQPLKPVRAIFTVQVGVFSKVPYAKSLAARLNKKGYNSYITILNSKREKRLYKVFVGKFSDRKKAEILSEKIKRTEGLQAFVTSIKGK
jgi:cell division septation protein DedD